MVGETDPMDGETRNFGGKCRSQGITALYPYLWYKGASTNEVDLKAGLSRFNCTLCHIAGPL